MMFATLNEQEEVAHAAHLEALILKGMQSRREEVLHRKGKLDRRLDDFERIKLRRPVASGSDRPDDTSPKLYDNNRPGN